MIFHSCVLQIYSCDALSIIQIYFNVFQIYNHISLTNILVMQWVFNPNIFSKYSKYIVIFHWCALQIYSCDALSMGESRKFGLGGDSKDSQHIINNQLKRPVLLQKKTHDQQSNLAIIVYHDIKPILWCFIRYFWSKKTQNIEIHIVRILKKISPRRPGLKWIRLWSVSRADQGVQVFCKQLTLQSSPARKL